MPSTCTRGRAEARRRAPERPHWETGGVTRLSVEGVRPAVPLDAASIAAIQLRSWQAAADVPADLLATLSNQAVQDGWAHAITRPPSRRHRVLVAVSDGVVAGFAATAPAEDPDSDPQVEGEILALHVDPSHRVAGHGSRLLAACVDALREEGCAVGYHWVTSADAVSRAFFEGAGWAPDGASRRLDLHGDGSTTVGQTRLHTALDADPSPRV
jgi:GNAT superfamily N-acetyltransferase